MVKKNDYITKSITDLIEGAGSHFFSEQETPLSRAGMLGYASIDYLIKTARCVELAVTFPYVIYESLRNK